MWARPGFLVKKCSDLAPISSLHLFVQDLINRLADIPRNSARMAPPLAGLPGCPAPLLPGALGAGAANTRVVRPVISMPWCSHRSVRAISSVIRSPSLSISIFLLPRGRSTPGASFMQRRPGVCRASLLSWVTLCLVYRPDFPQDGRAQRAVLRRSRDGSGVVGAVGRLGAILLSPGSSFEPSPDVPSLPAFPP